jgi:hypothetical protein
MIRRIVTSKTQAAEPGHETDSYVDRIVKYIPTEIVGAWIAVKGIVEAAVAAQRQAVLWVCFALSVVLTLLYVLKRTAAPGKPPAVGQALISTAAFVVWAFALGEPFSSLLGGPTQALYGSLLLIFFTLAAGLVVPKES